MKTIEQWMDETGACADAREWAKQYKSLTAAWDACMNPSWMLWAIDKCGIAPSDVRHRLLACRFVRETPLVDGRKVWDLLTDDRSRNAVEVAERHAAGNATDTELAAASEAALVAAGDTEWAIARDAASEAAWAAARAAAGAAAWTAAGYVAAAARTAAWDVDAAAAAAAWAAQSSSIRSVFPNPAEEQT